MVVPLHGVKLVATMKQPCDSGTSLKRRDVTPFLFVGIARPIILPARHVNARMLVKSLRFSCRCRKR